jgi:hypothetical protein
LLEMERHGPRGRRCGEVVRSASWPYYLVDSHKQLSQGQARYFKNLRVLRILNLAY